MAAIYICRGNCNAKIVLGKAQRTGVSTARDTVYRGNRKSRGKFGSKFIEVNDNDCRKRKNRGKHDFLGKCICLILQCVVVFAKQPRFSQYVEYFRTSCNVSGSLYFKVM